MNHKKSRIYTIILIFSIILFILFILYFLKSRISEFFDKIPNLEINDIKKKNDILLLHYGNINLDIKTFSENVKKYAEKHKIDYYNSTSNNIWQILITIFDKHNYDYIFMIPTNAYFKDANKNFRKLIEESGDAHMILSRDEKNSTQINTDVIIFKNSDWSIFKLYHFYNKKIIDTDIILDQYYTNSQHKTFGEFKEYIATGIPYMSNNICVYNEHTLISSKSSFINYYDRLSGDKIIMYPWKEVKHPKFTLLDVTDNNKIENSVSKNSGKIPKIIFQTMESHLTILNVKSCVQQVKQLNPKYKYYYYTTYDCRIFIQKHFPDILEYYDMLLPGAYKADLWRYCVLYKYGGFYLDIRMYPYMGFDSIITQDTEFMSCLDVHQNMLYQAILGCTPGSIYMKLAIDQCVENIKNRIIAESDLAITGPRVMGDALNIGLENDVNEDLKNINNKTILLLYWNSHKNPKYIQDDKNLFACHKYTKLISEEETREEMMYWHMLSGKDHYSVFYNNKNIYKEKLVINDISNEEEPNSTNNPKPSQVSIIKPISKPINKPNNKPISKPTHFSKPTHRPTQVSTITKPVTKNVVDKR